MPFFRATDSPRTEPRPPRSGTLEPPADFLKRISIRQHAGLVGLLAERQVLINSNAAFVVDGKSPPADRIDNVDCGLLWMALTERLRGDVAAAEDALRDAIWAFLRLIGGETGSSGIADIDLRVAEELVKRWRMQPADNWFISALSVVHAFLHPGIPVTPDGIGGIWQDAWRLYAGALSVLGDVTSRRVPGDSEDYFK